MTASRTKKTRNRLRKTRSLIVGLLIVQMATVANAKKCEAIFKSQSVVSFETAQSILDQALKKRDFQTISRKHLRNLTLFTQSHPDRSHGFTTQEMYQARYRNETVIVKRASSREMQMAYVMSELGVGVKFLGVADFCDCYIVSFVPRALLIKPQTLDRRTGAFLENGFRLEETAKEKIRRTLRSLARLGIVTQDPNFLVGIYGQVFLIDPGSFYKGSSAEARSVARWNLKMYENQFARLRLLELEQVAKSAKPKNRTEP